MKILGIYNEATQSYVDYVLNELAALGHEIQSEHIDNYTGNISISGAPVFFIIKSDLPAYPLQGKQDVNVVINWAESAGI